MTTQQLPSANLQSTQSPETRNPNHWNLGKVIAVTAITLIALAASLAYTRIWLFQLLSVDFYNFFRDAMGLPFASAKALEWSAGFLAAVTILSALWGLLVGHVSKRIWILVFGGIAVYWAGMTLFPASFNIKTGEAQRKYVMTGSQCRYFDTQSAVDPESGKPLSPVTPDVKDMCDRLKNGKGPTQILETDPSKIEPFSRISGEPVVWYSQRNNGELVLFDAPGSDPMTGRPLLPIDESVIQRLERAFNARKAVQSDSSVMPTVASSGLDVTPSLAAKSSVIRPVVPLVMDGVLLVGDAARLSQTVVNRLKSDRLLIRPVLLPAGVLDVWPAAGRPSAAALQAAQTAGFRAIAVAEVNHQITTTAELAGFTHTVSTLKVRVINTLTGDLTASFQHRGEGSGFSADVAIREALGQLSSAGTKL